MDVKYLRVVGDHIYARDMNGVDTAFVNTVGDMYIPRPSDSATPPGDPLPPPTTGTVQEALVAWCTSRVGTFTYSQSNPGRLNPDVTGYTDCSGLMYRCYTDVTGLYVGDWTGNQYNKGTTVIPSTSIDTIDESLLVKGDLIFYDWGSYTWSFDHVEMYIGNTQTIGHGGPGMGPVVKALGGNVSFATRYQVQRYV